MAGRIALRSLQDTNARLLRIGIGLGDETADGGLEVNDGAKDAAFQSSPGELGKEALDSVESGVEICVAGSKMVGVKWDVFQQPVNLI